MSSSPPVPQDAEPFEIAALRRLRDYLSEGKELPDDCRSFVVDRLDDYLRRRGETSLDKSLGLRRHGGVSLERQERLRWRDQALTRLWRSCEQFRDHPPIAAARLMDLSASAYETRRWPRERGGAPPPSEPAATWWAILQRGLAIPKAKRLQSILQRHDCP